MKLIFTICLCISAQLAFAQTGSDASPVAPVSPAAQAAPAGENAPLPPVPAAVPVLPEAKIGTLALEQFKETFNIEFEAAREYYESSCGVSMEYDLPYANLALGWTEADRRSVGGYCSAGLNGLASLCLKGDVYKKVVVEKVKKYSCVFEPTATRSVTIQDGKMTWAFEYRSPDHDSFVMQKLIEML